MGVAIDTVAGFLTNAGTTAETLTDVTVSDGDSLEVQYFQGAAWAKLEAIFFQGAAKTQTRVKSKLFADNVTGITFGPAESPAQFLLPPGAGQNLTPGDTLTLQTGAAAGASTIAALMNYYSDLPNASSRLHMYGDISGIIANMKTIEVDVTTDATIGTWVDTKINTTDTEIKAHTDYAVLGFQVDTALAVVGIKGQATQNMRVCAPGATSTVDISNYFVEMSQRHGTPHIPVFNGDNASRVYVSALANTASVASKVYVVMAELAHTITP